MRDFGLRAIVILLLTSTLSGCSGGVTDSALSLLPSFIVNKSGQISLVENSTSEKAVCTTSNVVRVQTSFGADGQLFCRDVSSLIVGLAPGPICQGGVTVAPIVVDPKVVSCAELTLCGRKPISRKTTATRFDGGKIEELTFQDLPWGCSGRLESSTDATFAKVGETKSLSIQVRPPECPFCVTTNRATCLACAQLGNNETVVGGVVISKTCTGNSCASCAYGSAQVAHGKTASFFSAAEGSCGTSCAAKSLVRVCNNGLWEGDPKFYLTQCSDVACGCTLPNNPTVFDHGTTKKIYKVSNPVCGLACETITPHCADGKWLDPANAEISFDTLKQYPASSCKPNECHCVRSARPTIANGTSAFVYSKDKVACGVSCDTVKASLDCVGGVLTGSVAAAVNYQYDECAQETCGCRVVLAGNNAVFIPEGTSKTFWNTKENSLANVGACSAANVSKTFTCTNQKLVPAYEASYQYDQPCVTKSFDCSYTDRSSQVTRVAHQGSITVAKSDLQPCGGTCEYASLYCDNGTFKKADRVTVADAGYLAQYQSKQCSPQDCSCKWSTNVLAHGAKDNYYKINTSECGSNACDLNKAELSCSSRVLTTSAGGATDYIHKLCNPKPCGCSIPLFDGTTVFVANGSSKTLSKVQSNSISDLNACQAADAKKTFTCNGQVLSPALEAAYKYPDCQEKTFDCTYTNAKGAATTIRHNSFLSVAKQEKPSCGQTCEWDLVRCDNGTIKKMDNTVADASYLSAYGATICTQPDCDCVVGSTYILHGQTKAMFSNRYAKCGTNTCEVSGASLTCTAKIISGGDPGVYKYDSCTPDACGCRVPLNATSSIFIENNNTTPKTLYRYSTNTAADPTACTNMTNRGDYNCVNETLTPTLNPLHQYEQCTSQNFNCTYTDSRGVKSTVLNGLKLVVAKTATPACGVACESAELTCQSGTLYQSNSQPVDALFSALFTTTATCSVRDCDCKVGSLKIPHNTSKDFYSIPDGGCNAKACDEAKRSLKCFDGVISGADPQVFSYDHCDIKQCSCPLPWEGTLFSGETTRAFAINGDTCADPTACSNPANYVDISCTGGVLSLFDTNRYKYAACPKAICGCTWKGVSVKIDEKGFFYKKENPDPDTCKSVAGEFRCTANGTFVPLTTITDNYRDFGYATCKSKRDQGSFGGTGGGNGNSVGPGDGWLTYFGGGGSGSPGGPLCAGEDCAGTILHANPHTYPKYGCKLPWGTSEVEHYGSVLAFRKKCVVKPAKCSAEQQVRTCHFFGLSGGVEYKYSACEEKESCP